MNMRLQVQARRLRLVSGNVPLVEVLQVCNDRL